MKYLKRIELKDICTNNSQKEIKETYQKVKEYYKDLDEKQNKDN